jgi:hypothetical protein
MIATNGRPRKFSWLVQLKRRANARATRSGPVRQNTPLIEPDYA